MTCGLKIKISLFTLLVKYAYQMHIQDGGMHAAFDKNNIHLMYALEGNSEFCFPENLNVSRDEVEGNIEIRGKTKFTISRGSIH
jgi:hypothetical protein